MLIHLQSPESISWTIESDLLAYDTVAQLGKKLLVLVSAHGYSHLLHTSDQLSRRYIRRLSTTALVNGPHRVVHQEVEVLEWKPFADVRNCGRRKRILK